MRAVTFTGAGGSEVVSVQDRPDPTPVGTEVLVRVRYAGINPADVMQRDGNYPPPPGAPADVPGLEVAGEVIACGERALAWEPGDRVFGLVGGGGLADRVLVDERCVTRIPDALSDTEAAAVPEAFITAHDAIRSQARLSMGETLLVHGATGGVGTAAIAIGRAAGARVIGVSRSLEGRELVASLGAEPVADDGFTAAVAELTHGRGADVVLELVGAPHFPANLDAVAMQGRIVIVGVGAGSRTELPLGGLMRRRASLHGTFLRARPLEQKAQAVRAFEREVVPHLADRTIVPVIDQVFDVERVTEALERQSAAGKRGKLLLDLGT